MSRQAVISTALVLGTLSLGASFAEQVTSESGKDREGRFLGFSNPFGFYGHEACVSDLEIGGEQRVGSCYNEIECVAMGGVIRGYCGALVAGTVSKISLNILFKIWVVVVA